MNGSDRKFRSARIVLALLGACLGAVAAPSQVTGPAKPMIIAHRGGAALVSENTIPAFDNAIRLGVDMLEFDMVMTADDKLVVQHDATVDGDICIARPGSKVVPGSVRRLTLAQMLEFDCGSRYRDIYPNQKTVSGTPMPTPGALFARYKGTDVLFFGEIKMPRPSEGAVDPVAFAKLVEAEVRRHSVEDRFILQSSDYRTIDAMHAVNPKIRTCLLRPWLAKTDHLELARKHHATCMLLRLQDADRAQVDRLRKAGVMVISEVIDDEPSWRAYLARGDDALFTNDPAGLIAFLKAGSTSR